MIGAHCRLAVSVCLNEEVDLHPRGDLRDTYWRPFPRFIPQEGLSPPERAPIEQHRAGPSAHASR